MRPWGQRQWGGFGLQPASCAWQHRIVQRSRTCYQPGPRSTADAPNGAGHGDTDAAFPCGKPSSDQRHAAQHLGDGALPRRRHHERTGAPRISSHRYERRGLDDASRGLGPLGQGLGNGAVTAWNRKKRTRKWRGRLLLGVK